MFCCKEKTVFYKQHHSTTLLYLQHNYRRKNKCIFRQIILILNAKMISADVYCEPVCDPLLAQTQMNGTAACSSITRHLHGNPNHLHMIKMSLVTAHHAKWALSVTSHTKKSNWAAVVCGIRDMVVGEHNGVNTHIFPLNVRHVYVEHLLGIKHLHHWIIECSLACCCA